MAIKCTILSRNSERIDEFVMYLYIFYDQNKNFNALYS